MPVWNPHQSTPGNARLIIRVLVLNYDPIVPFEGHRHLSEVFSWSNPKLLAKQYIEALEDASGGYLKFQLIEWRDLNEIYADVDGWRYTIQEYVHNRRQGSNADPDYPRLLHEQNVESLVNDGRIDEVWIFSDHYFGLYEASMAGPGAFFINGGVYPSVPSRKPFAFYCFNYERGLAEMMHNTAHRTEATLNRIYGTWDLAHPNNNWELLSANYEESYGLAGVGTCHFPPNGRDHYDYSNPAW